MVPDDLLKAKMAFFDGLTLLRQSMLFVEFVYELDKKDHKVEICRRQNSEVHRYRFILSLNALKFLSYKRRLIDYSEQGDFITEKTTPRRS